MLRGERLGTCGWWRPIIPSFRHRGCGQRLRSHEQFFSWELPSRPLFTPLDRTVLTKMDPISIAATVTSLVFTIVKNGRMLAVAYSSYKDAQNTLFMIQTECSVLAAALSLIQVRFGGTEGSAALCKLPKLVIDTLDLSLTATSMTMSVLRDETDELVRGAELSVTLKSKERAKFVWKEETMSGLLQQLRGQGIALGLLLKAIDRFVSGSPSDQSRERSVEYLAARPSTASSPL